MRALRLEFISVSEYVESLLSVRETLKIEEVEKIRSRRLDSNRRALDRRADHSDPRPQKVCFSF